MFDLFDVLSQSFQLALLLQWLQFVATVAAGAVADFLSLVEVLIPVCPPLLLLLGVVWLRAVWRLPLGWCTLGSDRSQCAGRFCLGFDSLLPPPSLAWVLFLLLGIGDAARVCCLPSSSLMSYLVLEVCSVFGRRDGPSCVGHLCSCLYWAVCSAGWVVLWAERKWPRDVKRRRNRALHSG